MTAHQEYEDDFIPAVLDVLARYLTNEEDEVPQEITPHLVDFSYKSLTLLDQLRREGAFLNNELPDFIARSIDNLAATWLKTAGGGQGTADFFRNRSKNRPQRGLN